MSDKLTNDSHVVLTLEDYDRLRMYEKAYEAIYEFKQWMRQEVKYRADAYSNTEYSILYDIYTKLHDIASENDVEL